jgi:hypothetical protein
MKALTTTFGQAVMWMLLFGCSCSAWAQQATINRDAVLHRDPAGRSKALEHLIAGARVTLVDVTTDSGFYHIKTEDDQVGWVSEKFVSIPKAASPVPIPKPPGVPPSPDGSCDDSLWNHVYHAQRLIVNQQCISVTGTIVDATNGREPDGVRHEKDGDTHGWLQVDSEFQKLLNAGNMNDEGGNLVFEIVCRFPVTQQDAVAACKGYKDQVNLPKLGSHVRIVGTYVQDTFHGQWMEIHPVTSITLIP